MLMPAVNRRACRLITLLATSMLMVLSGAATASARGAPVETPTPTTSGSKITVMVSGNGLKAGSAGSNGGGPQYLLMPAVCWMTPYKTGKDYYHYVMSGQMDRDNIHFGGARTAEQGFALYKDDDKGHWYGPDCDEANWTVQNDSAGFAAYEIQFRIDNPYEYVKANDPEPQPADVPVEQLRDFALSQLELPDPELNWNPKLVGNQGTLVNLETWFWLDNAPKSLEVNASVPSGTNASVTATFGGMKITAPGEEAAECPDRGTPYAAGARATTCSLAFSRASSALGAATTPVTVTTRWTGTWKAMGAPMGALTTQPDPISTTENIRVDEVQTLVTGAR
jgi:hypothetical protein